MEMNTLWFTNWKGTRYGLLMERNTLWFTIGKETRYGLLMGRKHVMVY